MSGLDKSAIDAIQARYRKWDNKWYTKTFVDPMLDNMIMVSNRDETILPSATVKKGLQSYQAGHHSKGGVTLKGRPLRKEQAKFDLTFETGQFGSNYYYSHMKKNGNNPREFPYQDFVIQTIFNQMYEDFTLDALWTGKKLGAIAGAPNNPGDIADGFSTHILAGIAAGEVVVTPTGIPTSTNAVQKVRQFVWNSLPSRRQVKRTHYLYCSQQLIFDYAADYEDNYGTNNYATDPFTGNIIIPGTKVQLVAQDGLLGNEMILVRPDNLHVGFDGPPHLELDYSSRQLKVEIDWSFGMQYQSSIELNVNEWVLPN